MPEPQLHEQIRDTISMLPLNYARNIADTLKELFESCGDDESLKAEVLVGCTQECFKKVFEFGGWNELQGLLKELTRPCLDSPSLTKRCAEHCAGIIAELIGAHGFIHDAGIDTNIAKGIMESLCGLTDKVLDIKEGEASLRNVVNQCLPCFSECSDDKVIQGYIMLLEGCSKHPELCHDIQRAALVEDFSRLMGGPVREAHPYDVVQLVTNMLAYGNDAAIKRKVIVEASRALVNFTNSESLFVQLAQVLHEHGSDDDARKIVTDGCLQALPALWQAVGKIVAETINPIVDVCAPGAEKSPGVQALAAVYVFKQSVESLANGAHQRLEGMRKVGQDPHP